jgi:hypothetical protein
VGIMLLRPELHQPCCRWRGLGTIVRTMVGVWPSSARVRACSCRWAPRLVHCICWRLAKRLLMTAFTVDSARQGRFARRRGTARRN